jgi:hypothetical protein
MKIHALAITLVLGLGCVASAQPPQLELVLQAQPRIHDTAGRIGALSGDGKLAVTREGASAILWDCDTGRKLRTFHGDHDQVIYAMAMTPDGKLLEWRSSSTLRETGRESSRSRTSSRSWWAASAMSLIWSVWGKLCP